jgi:hypothetical protein
MPPRHNNWPPFQAETTTSLTHVGSLQASLSAANTANSTLRTRVMAAVEREQFNRARIDAESRARIDAALESMPS